MRQLELTRYAGIIHGFWEGKRIMDIRDGLIFEMCIQDIIPLVMSLALSFCKNRRFFYRVGNSGDRLFHSRPTGPMMFNPIDR